MKTFEEYYFEHLIHVGDEVLCTYRGAMDGMEEDTEPPSFDACITAKTGSTFTV